MNWFSNIEFVNYEGGNENQDSQMEVIGHNLISDNYVKNIIIQELSNCTEGQLAFEQNLNYNLNLDGYQQGTNESALSNGQDDNLSCYSEGIYNGYLQESPFNSSLPISLSLNSSLIHYSLENGDNLSINPVKQHKCPEQGCEKVYKSRENLTLHFKNIHMNMKPYKCFYCSAVFSHRNGKTYHERKFHTKILPHKCEHLGNT